MEILNRALEQELALSTTLQSCLARMSGPNVQSLGRLFGDHRREIDGWLALIADRVRVFGAAARSGASEVARLARASVAAAPATPRDVIAELLAQHEQLAARLRRDVAACGADPATAELLRRIADYHETAAWMLRVVRGGPEVPGVRPQNP